MKKISLKELDERIAKLVKELEQLANDDKRICENCKYSIEHATD